MSVRLPGYIHRRSQRSVIHLAVLEILLRLCSETRITHHSLTANDRVSTFFCYIVQFTSLDTRTDLEGRARIGAGGETADELDVLEQMCADTQRTFPGSLAREVVAGVLDHQPEIEVSGKVHGALHVPHALCTDDIDGVSSLGTCSRIGITCRYARQSGEEG